MVEENLIKLETISACLLELVKLFENKFSNTDPEVRTKMRAKSAYYNSLIALCNEALILKCNTNLIPNQLVEFKRKVYALLRLADESGAILPEEKTLIDIIEVNVLFQTTI